MVAEAAQSSTPALRSAVARKGGIHTQLVRKSQYEGARQGNVAHEAVVRAPSRITAVGGQSGLFEGRANSNGQFDRKDNNKYSNNIAGVAGTGPGGRMSKSRSWPCEHFKGAARARRTNAHAIA